MRFFYKMPTKEVGNVNQIFSDPETNSKYLLLPIFCNNTEMRVDITEVLHETVSRYQNILFVNTKEFGKSLIIDGVLQSAEIDHGLYDNALLTHVSDNDSEILILGGGDGYLAQTALQQFPNLKITIVDLDQEVIRGSQIALEQKIFDDPRVDLVIGDAVHFLKVSTKQFDGIICDLTDAPIGTGKEAKRFEAFFRSIISLSKNRLNDNGWIAVQGGASVTTDKFIDEAATIEKILFENFTDVSRTSAFIPSYGEECAFLFGKNTEE